MTRVTAIHASSFNRHRLKLAYGDVAGTVGDLASFTGAKFLVFDMQEPGTRNMKVQVTFTPEGIAIQGDVGLGPTQHGVCSAKPLGLNWWLSELNEDNLAGKFLTKGWTAERALEECKALLADDDFEGATHMVEVWGDIIRVLESGSCEVHDLYEHLSEYGYDTSEGIPGWGFDIDDMGWLAAIQQAFRRLWDAAPQKDGRDDQTHRNDTK